MMLAMFSSLKNSARTGTSAFLVLVCSLILTVACSSDDEPEVKREILMQDECFPPPSPRLPNGTEATAQEMKEARKHVLDYIKLGQDYIDCVDFKAKSAEEDDSKVSTEQYKRLRESMWKQMRRVEKTFNEQVQVWRRREDGAAGAAAGPE